MKQIVTTRTVYTVGQLLTWMRSGTLVLKPTFQRRQVWKKKSKSLLIDTVVRGLPMPLIFLRQQQDLKTFESGMEVIDGQQRLRTLFSYIDPSSLADYKNDRDNFSVIKSHNKEVAGRKFSDLSDDLKRSILEYEISSHVFPPSTGDQIVLRVFARMNSTGMKLNYQEVRNAEFAGEFKTLSYDLAFEHLDYWRKWGVFSDDDMARMIEVESVSDYLIAIMYGVSGKSQPNITKVYRQYDDEFPDADRLRRRFCQAMGAIDNSVGHLLSDTRLRRPALFYSFFTATYDHMFGLKTSLKRPKRIKPLPSGLASSVDRLHRSIVAGDLPENVADAMEKATANLGTRKTRNTYFRKRLGLDSRK